MRLRTRGHDFELPIIKYEFNKRNFIVQSLFNYVWYCVLLYYPHFVFYCTHVRMSYVLNSYLLNIEANSLDSEAVDRRTQTDKKLGKRVITARWVGLVGFSSSVVDTYTHAILSYCRACPPQTTESRAPILFNVGRTTNCNRDARKYLACIKS